MWHWSRWSCDIQLLIEWNNCELNEWECKSRQCIPMESRCDIKNDCFDGSDELNCGKYGE
jgi:hypothetical protein